MGWHKQLLAVISKLGTQQARHLDKEPGEQIRFLRQHLGISLSKDCSQMLAARVPVHPQVSIDGAEDFGLCPSQIPIKSNLVWRAPYGPTTKKSGLPLQGDVLKQKN